MALADTLLSMSRAELISEASGLGVERADRMTRLELRDEILRRTKSGVEAAEARGLFGIARSMLASMMETGLKMPEAAALIRGTQTLSAQVTTGAPVATVTLAEIYAAQGHPDRALGIVDRVLETEPDHPAARRLRDRLVAEGEELSTALATRAVQAPPVLETTGEEIRTGEPPLVESVPTSVQRAAEVAQQQAAQAEVAQPGATGEQESPGGPEIPKSLGLEVRGSQLIIRWELGGEKGSGPRAPEERAPVIRVVGFLARRGRPGPLESRVPLLIGEAGNETNSGSVCLDGYWGASVCAALGFYRGDQFVTWTQTLLNRKAWGGEITTPLEGGASASN